MFNKVFCAPESPSSHSSRVLLMVKGKLILICQSGGEFITIDDGSMSYTKGEAHAAEINHETRFDDLKLKLAELCNLEYKSLSIKYFLPENRKTLITLSNDRDLKRMYEFHVNSVTADVFVSGKEGFDREALNIISRTNEIKLAEPVTPTIVLTTNATLQAAGSPIAFCTTTATSVTQVTPVGCASTPADSVIAIQLSSQSLPTVGFSSNLSPIHTISEDHGASSSIATGSVDLISPSPVLSDMDCTPADTVKKRRRTASWTISANGPTIVAVPEKTEEKRKLTSRKKKIKNDNTTAVTDNTATIAVADILENQQGVSPRKDNSGDLFLAGSQDVPPEKLVALWKDGITGVGHDFKSVIEFRDALQKYAIAYRFAYKLIKNDTNRASAKCVAEGCPWRIHASWVPSANTFRVKKMTMSHTCEGESWKSAHPSKNWLVNIIKDRLRDSPHHKPKEIANGILRDFGIELNYTQVWRGIEDAREQLQGSYKEAYTQLSGLCKKMEEANPGSFIKLLTSNDKRFERLFVSFHALIRGFQIGCCPLLFLDATSLKSKYHEVLLTATSLDGDDGAFPVAFCVVDNENGDSWRWFLEQLKCAMATSEPLTFVSDREKGLKQSVLEVFENAYHGYSMYHLLESFKKNLKGPFHGDGRPSLPINFLAAANALRLDGFKRSTEQIKKVSSAAYDWVMQIEPDQWTNAVFKGERYNHIMFDVTKFYGNWAEEAKELTITQKIETLRGKITELMKDRQIDACRWSTKLTPSKEEKLQEEARKAYGLKVLFSSDTLFEVHDDSINVVDIDKRECSCLKWKATGLPCRHAIAVFNCTHRNMYDYCSRNFTVVNFQQMYSVPINPVSESFKSSQETTPETETVLPPCTSKQPGQQKKIQNKTPVAKKTVCCTKCKGIGHNKATCQEMA
ncbi:hypothetical protein L6164_014284 [Bauhinia variegata]|uniref:Uncharacterized protein n=1 Tax=Bauhinia variegata TaxID=167791 RepID=A0ACB9NGN7_BAUVA|nr:hypothetical protein L6164_014284 [Bauhinia variegata]